MRFSSTRTRIGVSGAKRPLGRSRFARGALVLAWVVFWLNTAFLPCCESLAAAFDRNSDSVSQSTAAAQPAHHSDETHAEHSDENPSHCDYALDAGPAINGAHAAPQTDRVHLECFAIAPPVAPGVMAVNHFASRATIDYHPPPPFSRYRHTQRLLI